MKGTSIVATSREIPRISVMAQGKLRMKSWIIPVVMNKNGKKVILMAIVAEKIDFRKCVVLSIEACQRDCPSLIFSR